MSGRALLSVMLTWVISVPIARASSVFGPAWHDSFGSAMEVSKQTGRPMLLDFKADWCRPCRKMDKEVWPDPRVVALSDRFVCVSVDVDSAPLSARVYLPALRMGAGYLHVGDGGAVGASLEVNLIPKSSLSISVFGDLYRVEGTGFAGVHLILGAEKPFYLGVGAGTTDNGSSIHPRYRFYDGFAGIQSRKGKWRSYFVQLKWYHIPNEPTDLQTFVAIQVGVSFSRGNTTQ